MSSVDFPPDQNMLEPVFARWGLTPDGAAFRTPSSLLVPVRRADGAPAMLKHALVDEEQRGNRVMVWWTEAWTEAGTAGVGHGSAGSAAVLEHDGPTLLLDRATGTCSLAALAEAEGDDGDDEATRILCSVISRLHASPGSVPQGIADELPPLGEWFAELFSLGARRGGFFARAATEARLLLATQRGSVVLHGDVHHGNVLDFGAAGWQAIDPKGIVGDPAFDYLNLFCNPTPALAQRPGRLARQLAVVAEMSAVEPERLLRWLVAWCGLSATWFEIDGLPARHTLAVGAEAERLLGRPLHARPTRSAVLELGIRPDAEQRTCLRA